MKGQGRSVALPIPAEHTALRGMALEGLPVEPGAWRRYLVRTYGELAGLTDERSISRRVDLLNYGPATYAAAREGDGRVVAEWESCRTGRSAAQRPLLRCITKKGDIRRGVVAPPGYRLIDVDWRSSHLWIVAALTGDEQLLAALEDGSAYEEAALILLGNAADRKIAKIAVLASLNGLGDKALAESLECTEAEAASRREQLRERWPGLKRWPELAERSWTSPLGRLVELPDGEDLYVSLGWRLQSIEADALDLAGREIQAAGYRVVWSFYDQLLVEVPEEQAEEARAFIASAMDRALRSVLGLGEGRGVAATTAAAVKHTWGDKPGDGPPERFEDPGGALELPMGPVHPNGPFCAREALQRVLDGTAALPDLHTSPWLHHLADHEDLLSRLKPKRDADRVRSASKAAQEEARKAKRRDQQVAQDARQEKEAKKAQRSTPKGEASRTLGGGEGDDIREAVGAPADWPTYPIPLSWGVGEDGSILRTVKEEGDDEVSRKLVANEPWYVLRSLVDHDTKRAHVEIGYRHRSRWQKRVVAREVLRSTTKIIELAAEGVDVRSTSSKSAVDWASYCEPRTGATSIVTSRTGWHGDLYIQGPGGEIELDDPRRERSGWVASGTWEGWRVAVRPIEGESVAALVLAVAAVGPLLPWLELGFCPVVDISGPHCSGKTTALKVAGSGWGCPDEGAGNTIRTWDSTLVGLERTAAGIWHAPLLLDETGRTANPDHLRTAIYTLVQGRGKMRGTPGGMQATPTWENVIISSGESPLVSHTEAGGARGRPLSITTTPAISSLEVAQKLEAALSEHHGHLAPRLAAEAARLGPELKKRHRDALVRFASEVKGDTRMLSTAAAVLVAGGVLAGMGVPLGTGWKAELVKAVRVSAGLADQAGRALDVVREELGRNRACYHGQEARTQNGEEIPPPGGYRGVWRDGADAVGIFPERLRDILTAAKHEPEPVLVRWAQDGTLLPGTKKRKRQAKINGKMFSVYAFSVDALWPASDDGDLL